MWIVLSIRETIFNQIIIQKLLIYELRYLQECNVLSSCLTLEMKYWTNPITNCFLFKIKY